MLTDREMTEAEFEAALVAVDKVSLAMYEGLKGASLTHTINVLIATLVRAVFSSVATSDTHTRDSIADEMRHSADHIDMTCPHLPPQLLRVREGHTPQATVEGLDPPHTAPGGTNLH